MSALSGTLGLNFVPVLFDTSSLPAYIYFFPNVVKNGAVFYVSSFVLHDIQEFFMYV
jgi:hypothetical protein